MPKGRVVHLPEIILKMVLILDALSVSYYESLTCWRRLSSNLYTSSNGVPIEGSNTHKDITS